MHKSKHFITSLIRISGIELLIGGLIAAFLAPLEIHSYKLFSSGGKHAYEGFGFGSLMFAIITVQVAGYYFLAALGVISGYGLFRLREWSRKLWVTLLYDWLVMGIPLTIIIFLMLATSKGIPEGGLWFMSILLLLVYPLIPLVLIRWLGSDRIKELFRNGAQSTGEFASKPQAVLIISTLWSRRLGSVS